MRKDENEREQAEVSDDGNIFFIYFCFHFDAKFRNRFAFSLCALIL